MLMAILLSVRGADGELPPGEIDRAGERDDAGRPDIGVDNAILPLLP